MPIATEIIYDHLTELPRRCSLDAALELFDALGYQYADELPLPMRDWPTGVQSLVSQNATPPIYLARHRDFRVVYTHLTTDDLHRTVERPIVEHTLHKLHPYSLFVFANRDLTRWDFVNVKYVAEDGARRRTIRRIHVGPTERLHTAGQRLALLAVPATETSALELQSLHDQAFDVEEVTNQFYRDYVQVFDVLCRDIARRNPHCQAEIEAQVLLDRLLFLYFIQKKGWLDGQLDYLYQHFQAHYRDDPAGTGFYSDFLFPLFVALSNEGETFPGLGDVPFLNGGLFEVPADVPLADQLVVSNDAFRQAFDDLLERYNFTVREDTPLDVEVAIDPEMLGQIFENLVLGLERGEDRRKATGSYYTPRVIVHFMCRQALKEYLAAESGLDPARLEALMDVGPAEQLTPEEVAALSEMITEPQARLLQGLVEGARVLDPAVGSGAFLVGMLYEMVALTKLLDVRLHGQARVQRRNYDYDLKRGFIERNLYGVDIQSEAVRICELRQWLSLMVDYEREAGEAVPTLPNLSYRVRVGDSLIERLFGEPVQLDELADDALARQLIDRIQTEKQAYFKEPDLWEKRRSELHILGLLCELAAKLVGAKRGAVLTQMSAQVPQMGDEFLSREHRKLKETFEAELARYAGLLEQVQGVYDQVWAMQSGEVLAEARDMDALRTQLGLSFLWRLDFAEVFADQGGFDMVIANPPYLRIQQLGQENRTQFKKQFKTATGKYDIYVLFVEQGTGVLKNNGVLVYIMPNKFLNAAYGKGLTEHITGQQSIFAFLDFRRIQIFPEATNYVCILGLRNTPPSEKNLILGRYFAAPDDQKDIEDVLLAFDGTTEMRITKEVLQRLRMPAIIGSRKYDVRSLSEVCPHIFQGLISGGDRLLYLEDAGRMKGHLRLVRDRVFGKEYWLEADFLKPFLYGRDIGRYRIPNSSMFALYPYTMTGKMTRLIPEHRLKQEAPNVYGYLLERRSDLANRGSDSMEYEAWYAYWCPRQIWKFESPKLLTQVLATRASFTFDRHGTYYFVGGGNAGVYGLILSPKPLGNTHNDYLYLLGLLNSKVLDEMVKQGSSIFRGGYYSYGRKYIAGLPVIIADIKVRNRVADLVKQILETADESVKAHLEQEIDGIAEDLYMNWL